MDEIIYNPRLKAKIRIQVKNANGAINKASKTVKNGDDLYTLSGEMECYRHGYVISTIDGTPGDEFIGFTNSLNLRKGQEQGGVQPDIWKVQIRRTIQKHLKKEIEVQGWGIKVLSLFFVDRVANYRQYDDLGQPKPGPFAVEFESILTELLKEEPYRSLYSGFTPDTYGKLHGGYFASDKKGIVKDSNGNTQADDSAYELIMQDKEKLLSMEVPLRFIFSHSALREGWDNPNVFQICTLREMGSERDRRQTLGRGLRLPVDQSGRRIRDEVLNRLTVIANEDFESFASGLQTEYENECGIVFGKIEPRAFSRIEFVHQGESKLLGKDGSAQVRGELIHYGFLDYDGKILPKFDPKKEGFKLGLSKPFEGIEEEVIKVLCDHLPNKIVQKDQEPRKATLKLHKNRELDERFKGLWDRINTRTTYSVQYSSPELIKQCVKKIKAMPKIQPTKILVSEAKVDVVQKGAVTELRNTQSIDVAYQGPLYDPVAFLQNEVELTRRTLKEILLQSDRLIDYVINPQAYLNEVLRIIRKELHELMLDGIQYRKIEGAESVWQMSLFENEELLDYFNSLSVEKSIYDAIPFDSDVEHKFAAALDKNDAIKLFVKLPRWFKIETPVGEYNPDWAIVKADEMTGKEKILYLVRETKGTKDFEKLRTTEAWKIHCGRQHFKSIDVDFDVTISAAEV